MGMPLKTWLYSGSRMATTVKKGKKPKNIMADTIAVRRPASARPRPPPAKEEKPPSAAPDEGEDDGIAEDNETW